MGKRRVSARLGGRVKLEKKACLGAPGWAGEIGTELVSRMKLLLLTLIGIVLAGCATASYDETWSWDSPVFDEDAVLGQAGLLPSQQDALYTSIWTLGGGALERRREYQLRNQHELWVRRQVELGKMTVDEGRARIRAYTPKTS
jgi:hypothetical protein